MQSSPVKSEVEATRAVYASYVPFFCTCSGCSNFHEQWSSLISPDILARLETLGIDPKKPVEIISFGNHAERMYEILWAFISNAPRVEHGWDGPHAKNNEVRFYSDGPPAKPFDETGKRWNISIWFTNVPWVLQEPEED